MTSIKFRVSHSSVVRLWLTAGGVSHSLVKAGPDRLMPRVPADIPPGPAEVVVLVDGRVHKRQVNLPHGACASDDFIKCGDPVNS